jgi:hypothetical protein
VLSEIVLSEPVEHAVELGAHPQFEEAERDVEEAADDERDRLRDIERVLGRKISVLPLDRTAIRAAAPAELGVQPRAHHGQARPASHQAPKRRAFGNGSGGRSFGGGRGRR